MMKILWQDLDKTNGVKFPLKIAIGEEIVSLKWCTFLGVFIMMMIAFIIFKELVMIIFGWLYYLACLNTNTKYFTSHQVHLQ